MRARSVILLSGGLDSAANLAICRERDEPVLALTCDYGQRAAPAELRAAGALCRHYDVPHRTVDLRWLGEVGGSALTEATQALPRLGADQLDDPAITAESARSVWVPNRNGVFLSVAAVFAERIGAQRVVVGFNREEAATFPDNSVEFLRRSSAALELSTSNGVEAFSYTGELDKREIVAELRKLGSPFPFGLVWSCYQGGSAPCGECESCRRYSRALGAGGAK